MQRRPHGVKQYTDAQTSQGIRRELPNGTHGDVHHGGRIDDSISYNYWYSTTAGTQPRQAKAEATTGPNVATHQWSEITTRESPTSVSSASSSSWHSHYQYHAQSTATNDDFGADGGVGKQELNEQGKEKNGGISLQGSAPTIGVRTIPKSNGGVLGSFEEGEEDGASPFSALIAERLRASHHRLPREDNGLGYGKHTLRADLEVSPADDDYLKGSWQKDHTSEKDEAFDRKAWDDCESRSPRGAMPPTPRRVPASSPARARQGYRRQPWSVTPPRHRASSPSHRHQSHVQSRSVRSPNTPDEKRHNKDGGTEVNQRGGGVDAERVLPSNGGGRKVASPDGTVRGSSSGAVDKGKGNVHCPQANESHFQAHFEQGGTHNKEEDSSVSPRWWESVPRTPADRWQPPPPAAAAADQEDEDGQEFASSSPPLHNRRHKSSPPLDPRHVEVSNDVVSTTVTTTSTRLVKTLVKTTTTRSTSPETGATRSSFPAPDSKPDANVGQSWAEERSGETADSKHNYQQRKQENKTMPDGVQWGEECRNEPNLPAFSAAIEAETLSPACARYRWGSPVRNNLVADECQPTLSPRRSQDDAVKAMEEGTPSDYTSKGREAEGGTARRRRSECGREIAGDESLPMLPLKEPYSSENDLETDDRKGGEFVGSGGGGGMAPPRAPPHALSSCGLGGMITPRQTSPAETICSEPRRAHSAIATMKNMEENVRNTNPFEEDRRASANDSEEEEVLLILPSRPPSPTASDRNEKPIADPDKSLPPSALQQSPPLRSFVEVIRQSEPSAASPYTLGKRQARTPLDPYRMDSNNLVVVIPVNTEASNATTNANNFTGKTSSAPAKSTSSAPLSSKSSLIIEESDPTVRLTVTPQATVSTSFALDPNNRDLIFAHDDLRPSTSNTCSLFVSEQKGVPMPSKVAGDQHGLAPKESTVGPSSANFRPARQQATQIPQTTDILVTSTTSTTGLSTAIPSVHVQSSALHRPPSTRRRASVRASDTEEVLPVSAVGIGMRKRDDKYGSLVVDNSPSSSYMYTHNRYAPQHLNPCDNSVSNEITTNTTRPRVEELAVEMSPVGVTSKVSGANKRYGHSTAMNPFPTNEEKCASQCDPHLHCEERNEKPPTRRFASAEAIKEYLRTRVNCADATQNGDFVPDTSRETMPTNCTSDATHSSSIVRVPPSLIKPNKSYAVLHPKGSFIVPSGALVRGSNINNGNSSFTSLPSKEAIRLQREQEKNNINLFSSTYTGGSYCIPSSYDADELQGEQTISSLDAVESQARVYRYERFLRDQLSDHPRLEKVRRGQAPISVIDSDLQPNSAKGPHALEFGRRSQAYPVPTSLDHLKNASFLPSRPPRGPPPSISDGGRVDDIFGQRKAHLETQRYDAPSSVPPFSPGSFFRGANPSYFERVHPVPSRTEGHEEGLRTAPARQYPLRVFAYEKEACH